MQNFHVCNTRVIENANLMNYDSANTLIKNTTMYFSDVFLGIHQCRCITHLDKVGFLFQDRSTLKHQISQC